MSRGPAPPRLPPDSRAAAVVEAVARAGGHALVVGGWVRDHLRGIESTDIDLEVYGLPAERLGALLAELGASARVGRTHAVWKLDHGRLDVSSPRGVPERSGATDALPLENAFREAARHRDLTINAIAWDPVGRRWIDPWAGRDDLAAGRLREVDPETFGADPLRLLRVARFEAGLDARATPGLEACCRELDLSAVPAERVAGELRRILGVPRSPSLAFRFLERIDRLDVLPPIERLRDVPQDPQWHPEGDVFVHTLEVVDAAREIATDLSRDEAEVLLWAALCHDLGKPETTREIDGRVRARGHDVASARRAWAWLEALRLPARTVRAVAALVRDHLAPSLLPAQGAGPRAYRRLARRLAKGGVGPVALERLARADQLGRGPGVDREAVAAAGRRFLEATRAAGVLDGPPADVVSAERLFAEGMTPGPALGRALARARELQDERGDAQGDAIVEGLRREGLLRAGAGSGPERGGRS